MRISPKLHRGDIGTALALTPSEAGPRRQQTLLQVRAREEGFSVDHNIPTLPQASPIYIYAWGFLFTENLWTQCSKYQAQG